jgi:hypothetical protein
MPTRLTKGLILNHLAHSESATTKTRSPPDRYDLSRNFIANNKLSSLSHNSIILFFYLRNSYR